MSFRLSSVVILLTLIGCSAASNQDLNGNWRGGDAGLVVFNFDGGQYWFAKQIFIPKIATLLEFECASFTDQNGVIVPAKIENFTDKVQMVSPGLYDLKIDLPASYVDQQYRAKNQPLNLSGPVSMTFSGKIQIESDDKSVFSYRAVFFDGTQELGIDEYSVSLKRDTSCR